MKKLKLMTLVGTRPEIIKLSEVIKKCDIYFDHILVHTGQNYDRALNEIFFEDFGLRTPDHFLGVVGNNLGETIGNIISKSYEIMVQEQPDAVLILGDTNSALSAISAKRLKIPIFHMEAGNRCFDENLPEEINRRIVDHISDVNLPYTEHARRYLFTEGIKKEQIYVTGSPMAEVLNINAKKIAQSNVLHRLGLIKKQYILLSAHREENIDIEKKLDSTTFDSCFKFSFVRNPFDLTVSIYYYILQHKKHPLHQKFSNMTFLEYVKWYVSTEPALQIDFLMSENRKKRLVDYIGRFETINKDVSIIKKKLNLEFGGSIEHKNPSKKRKIKSYKDYYDNESIDLIKDYFKPDFELLGYNIDGYEKKIPLIEQFK